MPFDGIVTKCIVQELSDILVGGRVEKVFQPEADEIILNIRSQGKNLRLLLSANANHPRIHVTSTVKENPAAPPVFCMLLRKHLSGGKITGVSFYDFERVVGLRIESMNELGDMTEKLLLTEIMGKHSNIILLNSEDRIIDAVKHVDSDMSSVREIMPARQYTPPPTQHKKSPAELDTASFYREMTDAAEAGISTEKGILNYIKGFSPLICREICHRASLDGKRAVGNLSDSEVGLLKDVLSSTLKDISSNSFSPCIIYEDENFEKPFDYHCFKIEQYPFVRSFSSISDVLENFYSAKDTIERLKQKKSGLTKVLANEIDRCRRKLSLHREKLRDVSDREKLKLSGELITANIYCIPPNHKKVSLLNYYSESEEYVDIPMDENLSPQENAQRYFRRYSKAKSTFIYTNRQLEETQKELDYLESVQLLLENCALTQEIEEIRQELIDQGYIKEKRKPGKKKKETVSKPLRFISSDGYEILVGKNNRQNDLLTMKNASSNDMWLHTRNIPGSHVIVRKQQNDIPDATLVEAAEIAAFHSRARNSSTIPVDYTTVKNVKKPPGAKPGMVIYENFKTVIVTPVESKIKKLGSDV